MRRRAQPTREKAKLRRTLQQQRLEQLFAQEPTRLLCKKQRRPRQVRQKKPSTSELMSQSQRRQGLRLELCVPEVGP